MDCSCHHIFYKEKLSYLDHIIRKNLRLSFLVIIPTSLVSLCFKYPMWILLGDQNERIYLVFPSYTYANRYVDMFTAAIENHRSVNIAHYENIFVAAY